MKKAHVYFACSWPKLKLKVRRFGSMNNWMSLTVATRPAAKVEAPWALNDLPPYRPVARKLMQLTADENVGLWKVQDVLRTDAVFTADVLRLANSPLIGLRTPVASVMRAVMIIGLDRIKNLATTLALR